MSLDADMRKVTERHKKWADAAIITGFRQGDAARGPIEQPRVG